MNESMSRYLIHERPLTVQPTLIKVFGVEQAIILQQFHWLLNQPRTGIEHDGQRWIWGTYEQWCEDYFPFWQARTLRYHINKLQKVDIIITKALRQIDWDHTNYYTINYAKFDASIRQHVAPSMGQSVAPSFKGTKKTTDLSTEKTTDRAFESERARAATPTPPPVTPTANVNGSKPRRLPNDSADMPDSSNPPSPSSGAPSPRKAKPATIDSPHIDGRKWGKGGYIQAGLGTTAVEVYYEGFSINDADARLNALDEDDLHRHCTDLARLREVITAYRRKKSYKKGNIQLILDWYGDPGKMNAPVIQRGATTDGTNTKPPIDAAPTQPSPYARLRAGK